MTVDVNDESGEDVDAPRLATLSRFVLDRLRVHPLAELSVLAVDKATMATLHEQWMDEPGPTDVLSFPMDELRPGTDDRDPEPGRDALTRIASPGRRRPAMSGNAAASGTRSCSPAPSR